MKFAIRLAFLFSLPSVALAFPSIKDKVEYRGIYTPAAGGSINFNQTLEIIDYDAITHQYVVKNVQVANGQKKTSTINVAADQFPSNQMIQETMGKCTQQRGTLEVVDVPAGRMDTCALPQENGGRVWLAEVPFGIAKLLQIDPEGNRLELELISFVGR